MVKVKNMLLAREKQILTYPENAKSEGESKNAMIYCSKI